MSGPLLFLFACLLGSVLSVDLDVELKGDLKPGVVLMTTFRGNWETVAALTVKENKKAVRVCVVETPTDDFMLPNNTAYWNITCLYSHVFGGPTPPPVPVPVPVPEPQPEPQPEPEPAPQPHPEPEPAPQPHPEPEPEPEPAPQPHPEPEPEPQPHPEPEPKPEPAPEPHPEPEPAPQPTKRSMQDDTQNVVLRDVRYTIGITLENPGKDDTDTFELSAKGTGCASGAHEVYDAAEEKCINATAIMNEAHVMAGNHYFTLTLGPLVGSMTVMSTGANDMIYVRFAGTPSAAVGQNDANGKGNARIDVPRPGTYFFLVVAEGEANVTVTTEDCSKSNMTAGPGCKVPYIDSMANPYLMNILDAPKSWRYWRVIINENHTELWASVRSDSGMNLPSIYAAQGNLPTTDSYQIMNCNFEYCDGAHIIKMNFTDAKENPQVWYIGTFTEVANNTYGVWFDSVCAQECTEQNTGTCQDTSPDYGKCVCATSSLTGVDCTIRNGLGPEYIVLIIIAALVVASAIIGFVAWAYMRRKRVQYEHVS